MPNGILYFYILYFCISCSLLFLYFSHDPSIDPSLTSPGWRLPYELCISIFLYFCISCNLLFLYFSRIHQSTHHRIPRMAVALWSSRTPGAAQLDRDRQMMNNKKKVKPLPTRPPLDELENDHEKPDDEQQEEGGSWPCQPDHLDHH